MRHLIIFAVISITQISSAQIEFQEGSWADILALAKEQNKPIMVDAFADWCGPCKWMAKTTFQNKEVGSFVNENFVPYKFDMEKGEGVDFAKANEVRAYPTILYFDSNGDPLHRAVGALDSTAFLALCKDALNPEKQLSSLKKRFKSGDKDKTFLLNYIDATMSIGNIDRDAFKAYWPMTSDEEKLTQDMLYKMFYASHEFTDQSSKAYHYYNDNLAKYTEIIGEASMKQLRSQSYTASMRNLVYSEDDSNVKSSLKQLKTAFPEKKKEVKKHYRYLQAMRDDDEKEKQKAKKAYYAVTDNSGLLNSVAWGLYEKGESKKDWKYGLKLVNRSVKLEPGYANLDTQAALLFKLEKYSKAKIAIDSAIVAANKYDRVPDLTDSNALRAKIIKALGID